MNFCCFLTRVRLEGCVVIFFRINGTPLFKSELYCLGRNGFYCSFVVVHGNDIQGYIHSSNPTEMESCKNGLTPLYSTKSSIYARWLFIKISN
ncbi:hypothetical protein ACHQM5_019617 [Ranunculus cassubicifolius]